MSNADEFTDYVIIGRCRTLPTFRGYTVDTRCREFRKIDSGPMTGWEFIDFDSARGEELLVELRGCLRIVARKLLNEYKRSTAHS